MKDKNKEKKKDPLVWLFTGFALLKDESNFLRKFNHQILILLRAGIDYLIIKNGGKEKPSKIKKIKIK